MFVGGIRTSSFRVLGSYALCSQSHGIHAHRRSADGVNQLSIREEEPGFVSAENRGYRPIPSETGFDGEYNRNDAAISPLPR